MAQLILMQGLPASGKSTIAKQMRMFASKGSIVIVNRDNIRHMLGGDKYYESPCENIVNSIEENAVISALMSGKDVIVDACHLKNKYINRWDDVIRYVHMKQPDVTVKTSIVPVLTSLEECISRDSRRTGFAKAGEDVIRRMYDSYDVMISIPQRDAATVEEQLEWLNRIS